MRSPRAHCAPPTAPHTCVLPASYTQKNGPTRRGHTDHCVLHESLHNRACSSAHCNMRLQARSRVQGGHHTTMLARKCTHKPHGATEMTDRWGPSDGVRAERHPCLSNGHPTRATCLSDGVLRRPNDKVRAMGFEQWGLSNGSRQMRSRKARSQ